jgi:hypothetical protein
MPFACGADIARNHIINEKAKLLRFHSNQEYLERPELKLGNKKMQKQAETLDEEYYK